MTKKSILEQLELDIFDAEIKHMEAYGYDASITVSLSYEGYCECYADRLHVIAMDQRSETVFGYKYTKEYDQKEKYIVKVK